MDEYQLQIPYHLQAIPTTLFISGLGMGRRAPRESDLIWFGFVWVGLVWFGLVWFGCSIDQLNAIAFNDIDLLLIHWFIDPLIY